MDFEFGEEQLAIRDLAREILEREASIDRVKAAEAGEHWTDESLWKTLAEANLLGVAIDEDHGGMGFGFVELCVLLEEIKESLNCFSMLKNSFRWERPTRCGPASAPSARLW